jgi:hypothetical protein
LRELARVIAAAAAGEAPVDDQRFRAALEALQAGRVGDANTRSQLDTLVREMDEIAWDIQDKIDQGGATDDEYARAFDRARAAAAVYWGFDPDPDVAALESTYEAYIVLQDAKLREIVAEVLSKS